MEKLIEIIKSRLAETKENFIIDERTFKLAKYHSLVSFLYEKMSLKTDKKIQTEVQQIYFSELRRDTLQLKELEKITLLLEKEAISCLPLKGSFLKYLYPETNLRKMCDLDILVKEEDFLQACHLLKKEGYQLKSRSENHFEFEKEPFYVVELHQKLLSKKEYGANIFEDIFARSYLKEGYHFVYEMRNEDFYLFMLCHLLKHYLSGGTGLRSFVDIYVFLKKYEVLNWEYIQMQIQTTKYSKELDFFYQLTLALFVENRKLTQEEQDGLNYVLYSGTYGSFHNLTKNELEENRNSNHIIRKKIFPKISTLKAMYPYLKKCILLLPIAYLQYCFHFLKNASHTISRVKELKKMEKEKK